MDPSQLADLGEAQIVRLAENRTHDALAAGADLASVSFAGSDLADGLPGNAQPTRDGGSGFSAGSNIGDGLGGQGGVTAHDAIRSNG